MLKLTRFEVSWLKTFAFLILFITGFFLIRPLLPTTHRPQPLADPATLKSLASGLIPPPPPFEAQAQFHGQHFTLSPQSLADNMAFNILGASLGQNKRIEVDLTQQKVYAFEGGRKVYEFLVSTGKWAPTPTGTFRIWAKIKAQKMSGGDQALGTYYYLPNVPWVMFFYNQEIGKMRGFSLHGTYWHNNFGHPMSHGCINMKISDAALLYAWADPPVTDPKAWATLETAETPGTPVIIYGETPKE